VIIVAHVWMWGCTLARRDRDRLPCQFHLQCRSVLVLRLRYGVTRRPKSQVFVEP
jgi:hypothetical protein